MHLRKSGLLKAIILVAAFFVQPMQTSAQDLDRDSLDYELQRQKVNRLLDARTARFGHYDESLRKRSGIFGLKTKRDMQASIDILLDIVRTDNEIFRETRRLLQYKDQMLEFKEFEKGRITELAEEYDQRINGYINTISKLQRQHAEMQAEIESQRASKGILSAVLVILIALIAIGFTIRWYRKQKLTKL